MAATLRLPGCLEMRKRFFPHKHPVRHLFGYVPGLGSYVCPADKSRTKGNTRSAVTELLDKRLSESRLYRQVRLVKSGLPGLILRKQVRLCSPSEMFVFVEDHPDSIDDGAFETSNDKTWWELPTDRHSQGGNFSMADGHAEHKHWKSQKKFIKYYQSVASKSDEDDLRWLHIASLRISSATI